MAKQNLNMVIFFIPQEMNTQVLGNLNHGGIVKEQRI